ncbi:MAG: hypothetical protein Kow0020_00260 [Wenzhouxiangellaceae bacterium]
MLANLHTDAQHWTRLPMARLTDTRDQTATAQPGTAGPATGEMRISPVDFSHELICALSPELIVTEASPSAQRVLGWTADQLLGRRIDDFCHSADLAGLLTALESVRESGNEAQATVRMRSANDRWRWCEIYLQAGPDQSLWCAIQDVSRFKRIEQAIERVAREWRSTFDAVDDAIVMLDGAGTILRVNRSALGLLDCEFVDLVGKRLQTLAARLGLDEEQTRLLGQPDHRRERKVLEFQSGERWLRAALDPITGDMNRVDGAVLILSDITAEKRAEIELRQSLSEVRELSAALRRAREEERRTVARQVHDELGHALTALKMGVLWLRPRLSQSDSEACERVTELGELVDQTIASMRALVSRLRPPVLDDLGLDAALEWLLGEFARNSGIDVESDLAALPPRLRGDAATALFHVVQEALTNVARHANASRVTVSAHRIDHQRISLCVEDDGRGFDPESSGSRRGTGLIGIAERVHELGGEHDIESVPGGGTRVRVTVPVEVWS